MLHYIPQAGSKIPFSPAQHSIWPAHTHEAYSCAAAQYDQLPPANAREIYNYSLILLKSHDYEYSVRRLVGRVF